MKTNDEVDLLKLEMKRAMELLVHVDQFDMDNPSFCRQDGTVYFPTQLLVNRPELAKILKSIRKDSLRVEKALYSDKALDENYHEEREVWDKRNEY